MGIGEAPIVSLTVVTAKQVYTVEGNRWAKSVGVVRTTRDTNESEGYVVTALPSVDQACYDNLSCRPQPDLPERISVVEKWALESINDIRQSLTSRRAKEIRVCSKKSDDAFPKCSRLTDLKQAAAILDKLDRLAYSYAMDYPSE